MTALYARLALASAFLVSVSGRWGRWDEFLVQVEALTPYLPDALVPVAAIVATVLEVVFAALLILGWRVREAALGSGFLLLVFAVSMMLGQGWRSPFWYSVFTASAASFLLAERASKATKIAEGSPTMA